MNTKISVPPVPIKEIVVNAPVEPTRPQKMNVYSRFILAAIVIVLLLLINIVVMMDGEWTTPTIPVIMALASIVLLVNAVIYYGKATRKNQAAEKQYQARYLAYSKKTEIYFKELELKEEEYKKNCQDYDIALEDCKEMLDSMIKPHVLLLQKLNKTLTEHYEQGLLFPKYRNWVAVSMIDEYLQSGRCDQLEGSNGAYNLFEMELRQNIIIDKLSLIIDNLEQIKRNQYFLYQEINSANRKVEEILDELQTLNETTALNTYLTAITALAETAPKVYVSSS